MNVGLVASVPVIVADPPRSRRLYLGALGLPLEGEGDGYYSSGDIAGSKHFGVWPLAEAAEACFGTPAWPAGRVIPQASIEFEVDDAEAVAAAGDELQRAGYDLLHPARTEPWGQTVTRLLTEEGLIVGISYAPRSRPAWARQAPGRSTAASGIGSQASTAGSPYHRCSRPSLIRACGGGWLVVPGHGSWVASEM